jgi:hypothetical protein
MRRCCWYRDDNDNRWDLQLLQTAGAKTMDAAMLQSPTANNGIKYNNKDADNATRGEWGDDNNK